MFLAEWSDVLGDELSRHLINHDMSFIDEEIDMTGSFDHSIKSLACTDYPLCPVLSF